MLKENMTFDNENFKFCCFKPTKRIMEIRPLSCARNKLFIFNLKYPSILHNKMHNSYICSLTFM